VSLINAYRIILLAGDRAGAADVGQSAVRCHRSEFLSLPSSQRFASHCTPSDVALGGGDLALGEQSKCFTVEFDSSTE